MEFIRVYHQDSVSGNRGLIKSCLNVFYRLVVSCLTCKNFQRVHRTYHDLWSVHRFSELWLREREGWYSVSRITSSVCVPVTNLSWLSLNQRQLMIEVDTHEPVPWKKGILFLSVKGSLFSILLIYEIVLFINYSRTMYHSWILYNKLLLCGLRFDRRRRQSWVPTIGRYAQSPRRGGKMRKGSRRETEGVLVYRSVGLGSPCSVLWRVLSLEETREKSSVYETCVLS